MGCLPNSWTKGTRIELGWNGLKNGLKLRLDSFEKWVEEKKKDSEMKKELIEKQLELIEGGIFLEEAIDEME